MLFPPLTDQFFRQLLHTSYKLCISFTKNTVTIPALQHNAFVMSWKSAEMLPLFDNIDFLQIKTLAHTLFKICALTIRSDPLSRPTFKISFF